MYPKVFADFAKYRREFGRLDVLPTPIFFYGMKPGDEVTVELDPGKALVIRLMAVGEADQKGEREIFFELNGQPRVVRVADKAVASTAPVNDKADMSNANHVPAPMPGLVAMVAVNEGQKVRAGDVLLTLEAMKMETSITAPKAGTISRIATKAGTQVDAKDLLVVID